MKVTGSLELVVCLLETLNKVASHPSPDTADVRFIEQLLMSAVETVVGSFPVSFMGLYAPLSLTYHIRRLRQWLQAPFELIRWLKFCEVRTVAILLFSSANVDVGIAEAV